MKKSRGWLKKIANDRKLRAGGFSVLLTALAVALALLLGALSDGLEKRYALQADYSFNGATSQSEVTRAAIRQLDKEVTLFAVSSSSGADETLLSLVNRYDAASEKIASVQESLVTNPVLQQQYRDAVSGQKPVENCLIVHCGETGLTRILTSRDFVLYSYNAETGAYDQTQYSYEKSVTEAILFVVQDEVPCVQILTGHGEKTEDETALLEETLTSANYQVKRVSLSAGDELDPQSPLMILCPRYDFSEEEISLLMDFASRGGDFFIVSQYADPTYLERFQALLRAYGLQWYPGMVIAKAEDTAGYYAGSTVALMPTLQEADVTRTLLSGGETVFLLSSARAWELPQTVPDGVMLSPILTTGEAYIRNFGDGESTSQQQPSDPEGHFAVAVWADKLFDSGIISHAFVIGDLTLFVDSWIRSNTSSTALLLQVIRFLRGSEPVSLDILPIQAQRESLSLKDITPAIIVTVMLPLLVLLGAVLVLWPRKNL
ncbi:MAG: Gldg family protein [Clostridia bacterium]|nr:Gldg family protein [Clostridia bacterium]